MSDHDTLSDDDLGEAAVTRWQRVEAIMIGALVAAGAVATIWSGVRALIG